jgi:hypothetical protein
VPLAWSEEPFEVIETKPANQFSFYFRRPGTSPSFLLVSARCPDEPRFWCFWVHRCRIRDTVDALNEPWVSPERLRREELPARAQAIHDDINGWLKGKERAKLRRWILDSAS